MQTDAFMKRVLMSVTGHLDYAEDSMDKLRAAAREALDLVDHHGGDVPDADAEHLLASLQDLRN